MKRSLFLLLTLCAAFRSHAAAVPAPDSLLAGDTLAMLTVPDYTKAKGVWGQWPSTRLWSDPALKPFRDKFVAKLKSEFLEPMERALTQADATTERVVDEDVAPVTRGVEVVRIARDDHGAE